MYAVKPDKPVHECALSVLIVDDHLLVGETIARSLSLSQGFNVTTAFDIASAIARITENGKFDVILLDYEIPGTKSLDGMKRLIHENDGGVALFSGVARWAAVDRALDRGAVGFVPKTSPLKTLQNAIRIMADGEIYLPAEYMRQSRSEQMLAVDITHAESEVLRFLCEGMTNKEIGRELDLNEVTVKMHLRSLFRKLDANNRTQTVLAAQKLGIFE